MSENKPLIGLTWEPKLPSFVPASPSSSRSYKSLFTLENNLLFKPASELIDGLYVPLNDPTKLNKLLRKQVKDTAGSKWFDMPAPVLTQELKKDLQLLKKTRILIIGGTGHLGKFIVEASVEAGNPTFVLIRDSTRFHSAKSQLLATFKSRGITLLHGDIYDHDSLVMAIKQVDVVISTVSTDLIDDQVKIIAAIKDAGNVKRFIPSDFGTDVDNIEGAIEPAASFFEAKAKIRRAIEAEGIPYTYISCYGFASYFLATLAQENATSPPRDKVVILSDGNAKAIFNDERDIATYTIRAVDDPRTLNRILHIRPPANIMSFNEVVSLWERKICKTLEKVYIPEDQVIRNIQESSFPKNFVLSLEHAVFVKGIMTILPKNHSVGVDATELYPDVKYTTLDEYLNQFI